MNTTVTAIARKCTPNQKSISTEPPWITSDIKQNIRK